jgi:hypothetical protein
MLVQAEVERLSFEAAKPLGEATESSSCSRPNVPDPATKPVTREYAPASREDGEARIAESFEVEHPTDTAHGHEEDGEHAACCLVGLLPKGAPNRSKKGECRREEEPCASESGRP